MKKIAAVVGLEKYIYLSPVDFAITDAKAVADAFKLMDIDLKWIWLDEEATWNKLDTWVNTFNQELEEGDEFYFFYAGHGFWAESNQLALHDTTPGKPPGRTLELKPLISALQSKQIKSAIFLDACHSGLDLAEIQPFSVEELLYISGGSKQLALFSACTTAQLSFPDEDRNHGIWTFYLLEALSGNVQAMHPKPFITANSLQLFLNEKVSARALALGKTQTPHMTLAQTNQFFVADFSSKFAQENNITIMESDVRTVMFRHDYRQGLKRLSGFKSGYFLPKFFNETARGWTRTWAEDDIRNAIDERFTDIRTVYKLTSDDIETFEYRGWHKIQTPFFEYSIMVDLSEDLKNAIFSERYLLKPSALDVAIGAEFNQLLGTSYDELVFQMKDELPIMPLVKAFEKAKLNMHFDPNYSHVTYSFEGAELWVSDRVISVQHRKKRPSDLIITANRLFRSLAECGVLKFEPSKFFDEINA